MKTTHAAPLLFLSALLLAGCLTSPLPPAPSGPEAREPPQLYLAVEHTEGRRDVYALMLTPGLEEGTYMLSHDRYTADSGQLVSLETGTFTTLGRRYTFYPDGGSGRYFGTLTEEGLRLRGLSFVLQP